MRRNLTWVAAPVLLAGLLAGCGGQGQPVGALSVSPATVEVGYPGYQRLRFDWRFQAPLEGLQGAPRVFVHLMDDMGRLARTFDHELPGGWKAGGSHAYELEIFQSALAPPLTTGSYSLVVGLYDQAGNRWPLETDGELAGTNAYRVAEVEVAEASADSPMFIFSSGWQPVEGGTDRQILGRRWLSEDGSLRLAEITRGGTLLMLVGIPSGQSKVEDLVLDDGASSAAVRITSSCGDFEARLEGGGSHSLEVPVTADPDGVLPGECEISFETNFYLVSLETLARRTIALENLAWSAGAAG